MIPNQITLKRLVKARSNFFIYGPRGVGKTSLINKIFKDTQVNYIYINCTMADKKINFFKYLNHQIDKFINQKIDYQTLQQLKYQKQSDPNSIIVWVENILKLDNRILQQLKSIYFFIDNIQQICVSGNFLTTFFTACQQSLQDLKLSFIFCGINLPHKIYAVDRPFRNIISFCMGKNQKLMRLIIYNTIKQVYQKNKQQKNKEQQYNNINNINDYQKKNNNNNININNKLTQKQTKKKQINNNNNNKDSDIYQWQQQDVQKGIQKLTNMIYSSFQAIQTNYNKIKKMTYVVTSKILQYLQRQIQSDLSINKQSKNIIKTFTRHIDSLINKGQLKIFIKNMLQHGFLQDYILQRKKQDDKTLQQTSTDIHYQYYPNLLLSALYMADQAPQSQDKRRFQDYKTQKGKIQQSKIAQYKMTKQNLQRVIAISQIIQDNCPKDDFTKKYIYKKNIQKELNHHSIRYYACLNFLKQENLINYTGKSYNLTSTKITGETNQDQTRKFMKKIDSDFDQLNWKK